MPLSYLTRPSPPAAFPFSEKSQNSLDCHTRSVRCSSALSCSSAPTTTLLCPVPVSYPPLLPFRSLSLGLLSQFPVSLLCGRLPRGFVSNEHPLSSYCIPGNVLSLVHFYSGFLFPHDLRKCRHTISAWNAHKYGLRGVSLLGRAGTGRHTLGRE